VTSGKAANGRNKLALGRTCLRANFAHYVWRNLELATRGDEAGGVVALVRAEGLMAERDIPEGEVAALLLGNLKTCHS
jgi:hypothetical protein